MTNYLNKLGELIENVDMKSYNTYRLSCIVDYMFFPDSIDSLIKGISYLKKNNISYRVLGKGSNIVLSSKKYNGVIIRLDKINNVTIKGTTINVEAGKDIALLAIETAENDLKGLEWATGIPGSVGGSIIGNAGAYNSCIFDFIKSVTILDENLKIKKLYKENIEYSYRHTSLKENKNIIVLSCEMELNDGNYNESMLLINDRKKRRLDSQPLEYPSAGSVFRNPEGDFAGRLIEESNLKGFKIGGAEVSEKHANFIINKDNATPDDIRKVIKHVHDTVKKNFGVDLIIEQEFIEWN